MIIKKNLMKQYLYINGFWNYFNSFKIRVRDKVFFILDNIFSLRSCYAVRSLRSCYAVCCYALAMLATRIRSYARYARYASLKRRKEIGQMKLEYKIKQGIFIRKKLYCLLTGDSKTIIKCSGVKYGQLDFKDFIDLLNGKDIKTKNLYFQVKWKELVINVNYVDIKIKELNGEIKTLFNEDNCKKIVIYKKQSNLNIPPIIYMHNLNIVLYKKSSNLNIPPVIYIHFLKIAVYEERKFEIIKFDKSKYDIDIIKKCVNISYLYLSESDINWLLTFVTLFILGGNYIYYYFTGDHDNRFYQLCLILSFKIITNCISLFFINNGTYFYRLYNSTILFIKKFGPPTLLAAAIPLINMDILNGVELRDNENLNTLSDSNSDDNINSHQLQEASYLDERDAQHSTLLPHPRSVHRII